MRITLVALLAWSVTAPAQSVEYRNGKWFDGARFRDTVMFASGGIFRARGTTTADSIVDLAGGYVVPPFGDAHQHLVDPNVSVTNATYLRDGIFYVMDQSNSPLLRPLLDAVLNKPTSFDFISAHQGWTSPAGHPVEVIKRAPQMMPGPMADLVRDSLDPGMVMQVDTRDDIERRWAYFLKGRPDLVKVYLLQSDRHAAMRNDARMEGNRGIDPALVPELVTRAHAAGLRVSAHVFTAADFRAAVAGGVDIIAHIPGGRSSNPAPFLLTDDDAKQAAARNVTVITTVAQQRDSAITDQLLASQLGPNITVLRRNGVKLVIGSDLFPATAAVEIAALMRSKLFTNLELLRLWSVATPQLIFPQRRIGEFREGFEASFLVLRADPLSDFRNTTGITMRVKRGRLLAPPR